MLKAKMSKKKLSDKCGGEKLRRTTEEERLLKEKA
jgi:hypothetical protein